MALQLEIVTPSNRELTVACDEVRLPGAAGGFGVRPGHTALMAQLNPGELTYVAGPETHRYAVGEGFCEVSEDRVRVLVEEAFHADKLDAATIARELAEHKKHLADLSPEHPDFEMRRALVERAAARAFVAGRK